MVNLIIGLLVGIIFGAVIMSMLIFSRQDRDELDIARLRCIIENYRLKEDKK